MSARYVLAAISALVLSVILSLVTILPFSTPGDDLGISFLWMLVFSIETALFIPFSLALAAELVERGIQRRNFHWSKVLLRFVMALPILAEPAYALIAVAPFIESHRPSHWMIKEILLYCVSAVFAYFALRIYQQPSDIRPDGICGSLEG
jgi:hypothetical protein